MPPKLIPIDVLVNFDSDSGASFRPEKNINIRLRINVPSLRMNIRVSQSLTVIARSKICNPCTATSCSLQTK